MLLIEYKSFRTAWRSPHRLKTDDGEQPVPTTVLIAAQYITVVVHLTANLSNMQ